MEPGQFTKQSVYSSLFTCICISDLCVMFWGFCFEAEQWMVLSKRSQIIWEAKSGMEYFPQLSFYVLHLAVLNAKNAK